VINVWSELTSSDNFVEIYIRKCDNNQKTNICPKPNKSAGIIEKQWSSADWNIKWVLLYKWIKNVWKLKKQEQSIQQINMNDDMKNKQEITYINKVWMILIYNLCRWLNWIKQKILKRTMSHQLSEEIWIRWIVGNVINLKMNGEKDLPKPK
jgi:hypothetical protein